MRWLTVVPALLALSFASRDPVMAAQEAVLRWAPTVKREAQAVWGFRAPTPVFLGQIQQESGGNPTICSPYACGLAQFTPDTAEWIAEAYPALGEASARDARFDPAWAIRALIRYDRHLFDRTQGHTLCDRMWFTLRGYNGGAGWLAKEARLAPDPLDRRSVGLQCGRAGRSAQHCPENLGYPDRIINRHQPRYAAWGTVVECN